MPEAHLSKAQAQAFSVFVRENKGRIITQKVFDTNTSGYTVDETEEPMFIVFDTHISRRGEANLFYPAGFKSKLVEAGVIFEKENSAPPLKDPYDDPPVTENDPGFLTGVPRS